MQDIVIQIIRFCSNEHGILFFVNATVNLNSPIKQGSNHPQDSGQSLITSPSLPKAAIMPTCLPDTVIQTDVCYVAICIPTSQEFLAMGLTFSWLLNSDYRDVETVIPVDAVQKAEIRCSCLDLNKMRIMYQRKR